MCVLFIELVILYSFSIIKGQQELLVTIVGRYRLFFLEQHTPIIYNAPLYLNAPFYYYMLRFMSLFTIIAIKS